MTLKLTKIVKSGTYYGESTITLNGEWIGTLDIGYAYLNGKLRTCGFTVTTPNKSEDFYVNGRWVQKFKGEGASDYWTMDDGYKTVKQARTEAIAYISQIIV
tara:strand:- start:289 stop:594 length:306 start_codon:yes stop_codon:yes gene_type:complete